MAETPKRHCPNCGHELSPEDQLNGQDGAVPPKSKPRAFAVLGGIACVMVVFLVAWILPTPEVFTQISQRVEEGCEARVISTLASSHFGIETTGDARGTVERVQRTQ
jgi:hypothetical protein